MNKIADLIERLERVRLAQEMKPAPDGLSLSLMEFGAELSALDDEGIAALAKEWNITPDNVREMPASYTR